MNAPVAPIHREPTPLEVRAPGANSVVYALVVAILELEQRRDRGKVRRPMTQGPRP